MKKTLFILALIIIYQQSYSQLIKGETFINLSGSYTESIFANGGTISNNVNHTNNLNLNLSIGYFTGNYFALGVGFEYGNIKEKGNSTIYLQNSFLTEELTDNNANIIAPSVFIKYHKSLLNKLSFDMNLITEYGFIKSNYTSKIAATEISSLFNYEIGAAIDASMTETTRNESNEFIGVVLEPEMNYFITEHIGLILKLGGISYTNFDFEDGYWNIDFRPVNWNYGLIFRL